MCRTNRNVCVFVPKSKHDLIFRWKIDLIVEPTIFEPIPSYEIKIYESGDVLLNLHCTSFLRAVVIIVVVVIVNSRIAAIRFGRGRV